tara:strand:+ start:14869 stop:15075 length:207 start_codon:yes stop_codon:yes gene_type:complete
MKLSNQAMGAVMLALQKSLLDQTDIVPILKGFDFREDKDQGLIVSNPPTFKIDKDVFYPEEENDPGSN